MDNKILKHIKKVIIALAIVILCGTNTACAFSFGGNSNSGKTNYSITSLIDLLRKFKKDNYTMSNFTKDMEKMQASGNIDAEKIEELFNKLPSSADKEELQPIIDSISKIGEGETKGLDLKEMLSQLLNKLVEALKSLVSGIGGGSSSKLPVQPTKLEMRPKTAVDFGGTEYDVKLVASVYKHVDANGQPDSNKWAFLIHPHSFTGEKMANTEVGKIYYDMGYNIFAPDLRGAGDSKGTVSLGFMDSLDVYDWLTILNEDYNPEEVIVHGISLGAATTNFLSGVDKLMENGPTKLSTPLKPIKELKVVGLIEDCGYADMTQFANKDYLIKEGIGLTEENFEYYSTAENSLKYCEVPMLIIHGTKDVIVKVSNAETIESILKANGKNPEKWLVEGKNHAFIAIKFLSNDEDRAAYRTHVNSFVDRCTSGDMTTNIPQTPQQPEDTDKTETTENTSNLLTDLINRINSIFKKK